MAIIPMGLRLSLYDNMYLMYKHDKCPDSRHYVNACTRFCKVGRLGSDALPSGHDDPTVGRGRSRIDPAVRLPISKPQRR